MQLPMINYAKAEMFGLAKKVTAIYMHTSEMPTWGWFNSLAVLFVITSMPGNWFWHNEFVHLCLHCSFWLIDVFVFVLAGLHGHVCWDRCYLFAIVLFVLWVAVEQCLPGMCVVVSNVGKIQPKKLNSIKRTGSLTKNDSVWRGAHVSEMVQKTIQNQNFHLR